MISYENENRTETKVKVWNFPAGEVGVNIQPSPDMDWHVPLQPGNKVFRLRATLRTPVEIMQMLMTVDAMRRRWPSCDIDVYLPFIPYARQDRVCNEGDSLSAAVMASLINSCKFRNVTTLDPHSDVIVSLIDNVRVITQDRIISAYVRLFDGRFDMVIAPDAGAAKKAKRVAEVLGLEVAVAHKSRNMSTGEITEYEFSADVKGKSVLVVDDLIDGGYTFIKLAEKLSELGVKKKVLYATHGIFTKGTTVLEEMYDQVYVTNSFGADIQASEKLRILEI